MFCDGCGNQIAPGQQFCSVCGKRTPAVLAAVIPPNPLLAGAHLDPVDTPARRLQSHLHTLSIVWIVYSVLLIFAGLVVFVTQHVVTLGDAPPFVRPLLSGISLLILCKGALSLAAGWGLMHRAPWARMLAVILGILALFSVPFGTALGVYTLWVLMPSGTEAAYLGSGPGGPGRPV